VIDMSEQPERYDINISFLFFLLGFLLFVSIMFIFYGLMSYESDPTRSVLQIGVGIAGIVVVGYNLRRMQLRFSMLGKQLLGPRVVTTETCINCNYSNVRSFKEGDYIYAKGGPCPKCNSPEPMVIKAIFLQRPPRRQGQ